MSTGPSSDLQYATTVAAQMIGAAGMGETLISFGAVQGSAFSSENLVGRVLGDSRTREEMETLLQAQKKHVSHLMEANRHLVEALRDALLERHELIGHEITDVLKEAERSAALAEGARPSAPAPAPAGPTAVVDLAAAERRALDPRS